MPTSAQRSLGVASVSAKAEVQEEEKEMGRRVAMAEAKEALRAAAANRARDSVAARSFRTLMD